MQGEHGYSPAITAAAEKLRHHAEAMRNAADMRIEGGGEIRKSLAITVALGELEAACSMLAGSVTVLERDLEPLLSDPPPEPADNERPRAFVPASPMVLHVRDITDCVQRLGEHVGRLRKRLTVE